MSKEKLKVGDKVRLKIGGPDMVINSFHWDAGEGKYSKTNVMCVWQDTAGVPHHINYNVAVLEKINPS